MKTTWMAKAAFAAMVIMFLTGTALACQAPAAPAAGGAPANTAGIPGLPAVALGASWWGAILMGAFASLQAVTIGRIKNVDPVTGKVPDFDWGMAVETVVVGIILGIVAHFLKWAPTDLATWLQVTPIGGLIVTGLESLLNMVFRHTMPSLKGILDAVKGGAANPTLPAPPKP